MLDTRLAQRLGIEETKAVQELGRFYIRKAELERELNELNAKIVGHKERIQTIRNVQQSITEMWQIQKKEEEEARAKAIMEQKDES